MGQAAVLFRWSPAQFWRATPQELVAVTRLYREMFCAESESEKRRKFAIFKKEVEAADKERRWRRDLERRRRKARHAKTPQGGRPGTTPPVAPRRPKA